MPDQDLDVKKKTGWSLDWLTLAIWLFSALVCLASVVIHPPTPIDATLTVSEISFLTTPTVNGGILESADSDARTILFLKGLHIAELHSTKNIEFSQGGSKKQKLNASLLELRGNTSSTCQFSEIRIDGPIKLLDRSKVNLVSDKNAFHVQAHAAMVGDFASLKDSNFICDDVSVNGGEFGHVEGKFSNEDGQAHFLTSMDSTLALHGKGISSLVGKTAIPIINELHIWYAGRPGTDLPEEPTVIERPAPGQPNEIKFEQEPDKKRRVTAADFVRIVPQQDFALTRYLIDEKGIHLSLKGHVSDVLIGPAGHLRTCMPSLFDYLYAHKFFFASILAIATVLLQLFKKRDESDERK